MSCQLDMVFVTYNQKGGCFASFLRYITRPYDLVVIAAYECCRSIQCSYFCWSKKLFEAAVVDHLATLSAGYVPLIRVSLNAQFLLVYTRRPELCTCLRTARLCLGRYGANKGAIVANFCVSNAPMCLVACHFDAGTAAKASAKRVWQLEKTMQHVRDSAICSHYLGQKTKIFMLGDLNFRVSAEPYNAIALIADGKALQLLALDQLRAVPSFRLRDVLPITFSPTFKFERPGVYSLAKCPSYTDRILTSSDTLDGELQCDVRDYGGRGGGTPASYVCSEYRAIETYESDHLPVLAVVQMSVDLLMPRQM